MHGGCFGIDAGFSVMWAFRFWIVVATQNFVVCHWVSVFAHSIARIEKSTSKINLVLKFNGLSNFQELLIYNLWCVA